MIPNPFGFSYSDDIDISEMEQSIARLKRPQGRIDVVLDTDTSRHIDQMKAGRCKALLILFFKGHIAYHIVKIGGSRYRKHSSLRVFSRFQQKNGLSRAFHSQLLKMIEM